MGIFLEGLSRIYFKDFQRNERKFLKNSFGRTIQIKGKKHVMNIFERIKSISEDSLRI